MLRRSPKAVRAAVVLSVGWAIIAQPAVAHQIDPRHEAEVVLSEGEEGWTVRARLLMELPPDARARGLIGRFDLNRSGMIEPGEGLLLANELGPEAVGGFVLMSGGKGLVPHSVDGVAGSDEEGRIRVAVQATFSLPRDAEDIGVRVLAEAGGGRVPSRPVLVTVKREGEDGDEVILSPVVKQPGGNVSTMRLVPPTVDAEAPAAKAEGAGEGAKVGD